MIKIYKAFPKLNASVPKIGEPRRLRPEAQTEGLVSGSIFKMLIILLCLFVLTGCGEREEGKGEKVKLSPEVLSRVDELGYIPVLEYHQFGDTEERWQRTFENFRKDLEWLALNDYQILSMNDFINGEINVAAGKKPVTLTFDDSSENQFKFTLDAKGNAVGIASRCAVSIMLDMAKKYPELGAGGTFFFLPVAFHQQGVKGEKLQKLWELGFEVGNHTVTHPSLATLNAQKIKEEIGKANLIYKEYVGEGFYRRYPVRALAYPFGEFPDDKKLMEVVKSGVYEGAPYKIDIMFLVGASPSLPPYHRDFDSTKVPRIQAIDIRADGVDDEWMRFFNRKPGFAGKNPEAENFRVYVSDGDPMAVTVRDEAEKRMIDKSKLSEGVTLRTKADIIQASGD